MDRFSFLSLLSSALVARFASAAFLSLPGRSSPVFVARKTSSLACSKQISSALFMSSYYSDAADYGGQDDYDEEEDLLESKMMPGTTGEVGITRESLLDDIPTVEHQPVPMSKNSGNRLVAFIFDKALDREGRDPNQLHEDRVALTEQHVMWIRKNNLYNETFNNDTMADILWSHQILSSDLVRAIGHALCFETTKIEYAQELLAQDPVVKMLTGGDISKIPMYRWRHIRDWSLRIDDGRDGIPCMILAMDRTAEEGIGNLREEVFDDHLAYLIRSARVIKAGPLHLLTEYKDDPSSTAVGNLVMFNAHNTTHAHEYAENDPAALAGLYGSLRVHFYNQYDVTGKFVQEPLYDPDASDSAQMRQALRHWGYPVEDHQTPWLNW